MYGVRLSVCILTPCASLQFKMGPAQASFSLCGLISVNWLAACTRGQHELTAGRWMDCCIAK
jgi:hypothetical protein